MRASVQRHPGPPAGRAAAGKAARKRAPRSAHGAWGPAADRPDPVDLLERQAASRVGRLVPLRYGRMLASPFAFYRGAAAVMAADLAGTPASGFETQLCGDAHLSNFGGFASPERRLVFDLNDFDETLPGPWEWDVKRLVASFSLAARERGCGDGERAWIALMLGRDEADPLFLQIKEAQRSVLEPYVSPSRFDLQGRRVVHGQRLMQATSDIMLGWVRVDAPDGSERDFYVRQLWDWKTSAKVEEMNARALAAYAEICGMTLAHAHARGGDRIAIAAYLGKGEAFDRAMAAFAETYADRSERDYAALQAAVAAGRVEAE